MKKELPIHVWTERIDAGAIAVIAHCVVWQRGWVRGFSTFVLINPEQRWSAASIGQAHSMDVLKTVHHGLLPYICRADDAPAYL